MANPIRAWIVDRTYSPAYTFGDFNRLFQDDIVLSFQSDRITSIDGYDSRTLKIAGLIDGIDNQTLEPLLEKRWQEKLINHRGKYSLSESEWNSLKEVIISRNTDLSRVIDQLEAAQRKPSTIMSTQAITYDIMWSLTDMFRPGNWRQIHQSLRDARELAVRSDRTDLEVFFHSLEESGQYEKVDRVTDPDYALAGTLLDKSVNKRKSGKKPPRTEDERNLRVRKIQSYLVTRQNFQASATISSTTLIWVRTRNGIGIVCEWSMGAENYLYSWHIEKVEAKKVVL